MARKGGVHLQNTNTVQVTDGQKGRSAPCKIPTQYRLLMARKGGVHLQNTNTVQVTDGQGWRNVPIKYQHSTGY